MSDLQVVQDEIWGEVREIIKKTGGPRMLGETQEHQFKRSSQALKMPVGRIRGIWDGRIRRIWADELLHIYAQYEQYEAWSDKQEREFHERFKKARSEIALVRAAIRRGKPLSEARSVGVDQGAGDCLRHTDGRRRAG